MRTVLFALAVTALAASWAIGAPGEMWILPIHHMNDPGESRWIRYPGAGYAGTDAWGRNSCSCPGGEGDWRRIYWELSGPGSLGNEPPTSAEMYQIEFFYPTAGAGDWQPIESQFRGAGGEQFPIEPLVPWVGAYGTNHQWIASEFGGYDPGEWTPTGPGPHTPDSAAYNAGPFGRAMWLTRGSWLYAKWDFPWPTDRTWSALRLTQVTGCFAPRQDADGDGDVDLADFETFQTCFNGPNRPYASTEESARCACQDADADADVDLADFEAFQGCFNGPNRPAACP